MNAPETGAGVPARLECAAYSPAAKALATAFVVALAAALWQTAGDILSPGWTAQARASLAVMLVAIAAGYVWIMISRTAIDATRITQTWLWPKQVRRADIVQAKFIYLPWLAWIVAPRLVVKVQGQRRAVVFPAAGREVLAEFARLSLGAGAPPRP